MSSPKPIKLVPWDCLNPQHIQRLQSQRRQCGWKWDKVDNDWKHAQLKGSKSMCWITFADEHACQQDIERHIATYPEDQEPLVDTAKTLRAQPRIATGHKFHPIGHISLDEEDPTVADLGLNLARDGAYWINSLYVSTSIRGGRVGAQAMDKVEAEAAKPPLSAKYLILDAVHKDDMMKEDLATAYFGGVPKVIPHLWYERRGYNLIGEIQNYYQYEDCHGVIWPMRTAFLQRKLIL